jgi:acyl carrier protein
MNRAEIIAGLKHFIRTEIVRDQGIDLLDNEPLITGGIIDSFSIAAIAVYIETAFGVLIPDTELTTENMDSLELMADQVVRFAS